MDGIREDVRSFIVDNFLFGDDRGLEDSTSFLANSIMDSTGIMELISFLEQNYSITIADDELVPQNLDSIKNVMGFVSKKLAPRNEVGDAWTGAKGR